MTIGVLLMGHGTPAGRDDVARFYTDIRRGRPPTDAQLADLHARYDAIGGVSPLRTSTVAQAVRLGELLGDGYSVQLGMKHARPFIEDAARALVDEGVTSVVAVVLAPHFSVASVGEYLRRARVSLSDTPMVGITTWHDHHRLVRLLAERVAHELDAAPPGAEVVFTAHSLPCHVLDVARYEQQVTATARAVAGRLDLDRTRWSVAWQSRGRTEDPWLGPDVLDALTDAARRTRHVVVCPAGFVSDHLETLYDLDIEAARHAATVGIGFSRTRALEVDVCDVLADLVLATRPASSRLSA